MYELLISGGLSSILTYICYKNEYHVLNYVGLLIVYMMYGLVDRYLNRNNYYKKEITCDERLYVISNIVKSYLLFLYTPIVTILLFSLYNGINMTFVRNIGILYSLPDIVSLVVVNKMSKNTIIHHIVVVILSLMTLMIDYSNSLYIYIPIIYGIFSTYAYMVNTVLSFRYLNISKNINYRMVKSSMNIYIGSCMINWAINLYIFIQLFSNFSINGYIYNIIYMFLVYNLMKDDIILIKWLKYKTEKLSIKN